MIADKVYNMASFKRQYEALLIVSVGNTIPQLIWEQDRQSLLRKIDWNNMLSIASILCYSTNSQHLDAALRIAQTCLTQDTCSENQKNASAFILDTLTNKLSIKMAVQKKYISENYANNYPLTLKLQQYKSDFEHSILIRDNLVSLNRFQKEVYEAHKNNGTISISAPTSAGKSFILCAILLEELLAENNKNIIYVVPTRALISQVENDLRNLVKKYQLESRVNITTVPPQDDFEQNKSNVFVFTQERLHWFLINNNSAQIHLLIIDEAHKIEDGNRGILLQQKLEEIVQKNPSVKVYFSSPYTSNPEILLDNVLNNSKKDKINTQFVSVNQNLIFVSQIPRKPKDWQLQLCTIDKTITIGKLILSDRPTSELHKIVHITERFSDESGSLIYSNGAAEAENIALLLFDLIEAQTTQSEVNELIQLVKKTVHKDYALVKVLQKGIAFHYGNMPLLIRQEIEKLFSEGKIKYLICTSTLLEGINLPAKSIIIRKPTRGKGNPLNQNDFWNLAGRAGRWGKEFSGNIVCINPSKWDIQPEPNKSKQEIKRAINIIEEKGDDLLTYIRNGAPRDEANKRQDLEFAFGYFYIKYILNKEATPSTIFYTKLLEELTTVSQKINLPDYIIKRNPGISPLAQQSLLDYFGQNGNRIEELIPVYPNDTEAFDEYIKLVGCIGKTISYYPPKLDASRSILLINWMTGKPLSYIIRKSFESYQRNPEYRASRTLPIVIREVMDKIETFVRFRFAKDSSCYIDILRYFLELQNRQDLLANIPQLSLWLEFGVSQKTHLSLLALGLSRNTVIELAKEKDIPHAKMSKEDCLNWLRQQNLEKFNLSPIIIEDIRRIL